jgi:dTMP kinase
MNVPRRERAQFPGRFIAFEGVDGSGKSTQLAALGRALAARGLPVVTTREPGGTPVGEAIRNVVLDNAFSEMSPRTELLLYLASRVEHVEQVIRPALEQGAIVLCDRFSDATLAYQAYGRGLPVEDVSALVAVGSCGVEADVVILLDLSAEDGLARVRRRRADNRLDREAIAFHRRVRDGYLALAARAPHRFKVLDAGRPVDELHLAIVEAVDPVCAAVTSGSRR